MKELRAVDFDFIKNSKDFGVVFDFKDQEDNLIRFSLRMESNAIKNVYVFRKDKSNDIFELFCISPLSNYHFTKTELMKFSRDIQINIIELIIKNSIFSFCVENEYSFLINVVNAWSRGFATKFCDNYLKDIKKPILKEVLTTMDSEFVEISTNSETISGNSDQLSSLDDYYLQSTVRSITACPDYVHDIKICITIE